jgi:hypothetical protein
MYCFFQETSGNAQSNSTRETGAKNGNWDSGVAAGNGRAAARRHRAARGALPVDHRHGAWRGDRRLDPRGGGVRRRVTAVPLAPPAPYMAPGVGGFMLVGVAYLGYLYARHPRRVTEVGLVHLDEPAAAAETGPAAGGEATP